MKTQLVIQTEGSVGEYYISEDENLTMKREKDFKDYWVLRDRGRYVSHDQYRNDLAERNNIELVYPGY
jgi:hypothetical protein